MLLNILESFLLDSNTYPSRSDLTCGVLEMLLGVRMRSSDHKLCSFMCGYDNKIRFADKPDSGKIATLFQ